MSLWRKHPGVRSGDQLTLGERAADRMRNTMGSWGFVAAFLAFIVVWAAANLVLVTFDKYPFILLNLFLSLLAGLQGAILLIAAKRQDQISSELAHHDDQLLQKNTTLTEQIHELTQTIHTMLKGQP